MQARLSRKSVDRNGRVTATAGADGYLTIGTRRRAVVVFYYAVCLHGKARDSDFPQVEPALATTIARIRSILWQHVERCHQALKYETKSPVFLDEPIGV